MVLYRLPPGYNADPNLYHLIAMVLTLVLVVLTMVYIGATLTEPVRHLYPAAIYKNGKWYTQTNEFVEKDGRIYKTVNTPN